MVQSYASPRNPSPLRRSSATPSSPQQPSSPLPATFLRPHAAPSHYLPSSLQDNDAHRMSRLESKESSGGWKSFTKRLGGTVRRKNTASSRPSQVLEQRLDSPISIGQAQGDPQTDISGSHHARSSLQFILPSKDDNARDGAVETAAGHTMLPQSSNMQMEIEIRKFVQKHIALNWRINLDSVPGPVYYLIETMATHLHHARKLFCVPGDLNRVNHILQVFESKVAIRLDLSLEHPSTLAEALLQYLRSEVRPIISDPELCATLSSAIMAYKRQLLSLQQRRPPTPNGLLTIFGDSSQSGAISTASAFHIASLLRTLGKAQLDIAVYVISFLYHVIQRKNNDVNPQVLSTIFVPILFGPNQEHDLSEALQLMIEQWPAISGVDISACIFELKLNRSQSVSSEGELEMCRNATLATSASRYSEEERSLAETAVSSHNSCRDRYNTSPTQATRRLTLGPSMETTKTESADGLSRASSLAPRLKLENLDLEHSSSQFADLVTLLSSVTPKSAKASPPPPETAGTTPLRTPVQDQFAPLPSTSVVKRKRMEEELVSLRAELITTRRERDNARLALRMIRNTVEGIDLE